MLAPTGAALVHLTVDVAVLARLFCSLALLLLCSQPALAQSPFQELYNSGVLAQDHSRKIALFTQAIEMGGAPNKDLAKAYTNRGNAHQALGGLDQAVADFTQALRLAPHEAPVFFNRANALKKLKRFDESLADYQRTIQLDPDYMPAYYNRVSIWEDRGEFAKALADLNTVLRRYPDYANAYMRRGMILLILNRPQQSVADFNRALGLEPRKALAYYGRALAYIWRPNNTQRPWRTWKSSWS